MRRELSAARQQRALTSPEQTELQLGVGVLAVTLTVRREYARPSSLPTRSTDCVPRFLMQREPKTSFDRRRRRVALPVEASAGDRVRFLGERDHDGLPEALRAADFLLLPSDLDSFSPALLEGLRPARGDHEPGRRSRDAERQRRGTGRPGTRHGAYSRAVRTMLALPEAELRRRGEAAFARARALRA